MTRSLRPAMLALALATLVTAGCSEPASTPPAASSPVAAVSTPAAAPPPAPAAPANADSWLGRWTGPEGTSLQLDGGNGRYAITITDLDGPKPFQGVAEGDTIRFERAGVSEALRASTGAETGMKWLDGKSDCLMVREGEGYCRD